MKRMFLIACGLLTGLLAFTSCQDDDCPGNHAVFPNAIVTVKAREDRTILQLDDNTVLYPVNIPKPLYGGKEKRAFVNYRNATGRERDTKSSATPYVFVNWLDTIRTKAMAPSKGTDNDAVYGNDPLEIVDSWETVVEDGYLTIRFRTFFSGGRIHKLNLVPGEKAYEVVLHHDAAGDLGGRLGDGVIAFRLDKLLIPHEEEGKVVNLTLRWNSFGGERTARFQYRPRE